eukprot:TRINITY_DN10852_c0_g1_i2.p1 TRINITY_DN10852_c0_g1~~TRINITY_DN10852_c0_g1_i2.p1  ORF type:complete len:230 (-),score=83.04 TRINITY_DN10852_c0_g1_i2:180-869(-)
MANNSNYSIKFYGNRICPFAHRALFTAELKEVEYEYVHVPLGKEKPESYVKDINPRGTVPALILNDDNNKKVLESLFVSEFLDDISNAGPKLQPQDAYERYQTKIVIDVFGKTLGPLYGLLKNQEEENNQVFIEKITSSLNDVFDIYKETSEGPYLFGDRITIADIAIIPFLERFSITLPHYRSFDPLSVDDRVAALLNAARELEAFKSSTESPEYYIEGYKGYAHPEE